MRIGMALPLSRAPRKRLQSFFVESWAKYGRPQPRYVHGGLHKLRRRVGPTLGVIFNPEAFTSPDVESGSAFELFLTQRSSRAPMQSQAQPLGCLRKRQSGRSQLYQEKGFVNTHRSVSRRPDEDVLNVSS